LLEIEIGNRLVKMAVSDDSYGGVAANNSSTNGNTRRTLLFSAVFIMLVVALVNHPRVQFQHGKQGTLQQKAAVKAHGHVHHDFSAVHEAAIAKKSFKSVTKGSLAQATSSEKVKVRLYMESKCPACKKFTGRYVSQLLEAQGVRCN
jgi:hypothetical protein